MSRNLLISLRGAPVTKIKTALLQTELCYGECCVGSDLSAFSRCHRLFQHRVSFRQSAGSETKSPLDHANFTLDTALQIEGARLTLSKRPPDLEPFDGRIGRFHRLETADRMDQLFQLADARSLVGICLRLSTRRWPHHKLAPCPCSECWVVPNPSILSGPCRETALPPWCSWLMTDRTRSCRRTCRQPGRDRSTSRLSGYRSRRDASWWISADTTAIAGAFRSPAHSAALSGRLLNDRPKRRARSLSFPDHGS